MLTTDPTTRPRALVGGGTGLLVGVLVLNVVLLPGYTWFYDMVIVPDLPFSDRTLGTDGSVPRAVPNDAVVALLERALPGDVVQAALLLLVFVVVGAGCGRLARTTPGAVAAALAAGWNPYVVERLVVGHWSFLLGYATLPWIHAAALRVVRREPGGVAALAGWLALAALAGSTAAILAALTVVATLILGAGAADPRHRAAAVAGALGALAAFSAAWLVPSLLRPGGFAVDAGGVDAFRARGETSWGTLPALVTTGGIWHQPSWPASRGSVVVLGVALVVVVVLLGVCLRGGLGRELLPLAAAGLVGLVVAAAAALPGGRDATEWLVTTVPGTGLVRDAQKFVAPWAVLLAVAAGRAVDLLTTQRDERSEAGHANRWVLAVALLVAPVATLPDAPFAAGTSMGSVAIPADVLTVRDTLDAAPDGGVAVFPWTQYRRFAWNDDKISLDPWNRLLDRDVLVNDDLPLSDTVVAGEDPRAARVQAALDDPGTDLRAELGRQGIRWALVLTDQPGADAAQERLGAGDEDVTIGKARIVDLGVPSGRGPDATTRWPVVVTAAGTSLALLLWGVLGVRRRRRENGASLRHG